jgi:hypothetical protein
VGDHTVVFNRAVAASQAFEREFPEVGKLLKKDKKLPIEKWPAAAASWLTRGMLEQIVGLIEKAKDNTWALDVAIYEYELAKIVDAVDAAQKRGVKLRVIYEAAPGEEQTAQNEANLTKIPKEAKRARVPLAIFHDKFIVLSRIESGEKKPAEVLCGSTNFTENGVYRQANVVHVIRREDAAQDYAKVFETIWNTSGDGGATRQWIDANNPVTPFSNQAFNARTAVYLLLSSPQSVVRLGKVFFEGKSEGSLSGFCTSLAKPTAQVIRSAGWLRRYSVLATLV